MKKSRHLFLLHGAGFIPQAIAAAEVMHLVGRSDFVILGGHALPSPIVKKVAAKGFLLKELSEVLSTEYDQLHLLPAYLLFGSTNQVLSTLNFNCVVAHADGWRNGLFVWPGLWSKLVAVVYYGFELQETSFERMRPRTLQKIPKYVIPFDGVKATWQELFLDENERLLGPGKFRKSDLLICLRYWGKSYYVFRDGTEIEDALAHYMSEMKKFNRIVLRGHPQDERGYQRALRYLRAESEKTGATIVEWTDLKTGECLPREFDSPEGLLFLGLTSNLGAILCFDSSLNWLFGVGSPATRILWPNFGMLDSLFLRPNSAEIVRAQCEWMAELVQRYRSGEIKNLFQLRHVKISVDDTAINREIATMFLDDFAQRLSDSQSMVDTVMMVRDELVVERNQLVQQVNDLHARLSEVRSSLSWRVTHPLRKFLNLPND